MSETHLAELDSLLEPTAFYGDDSGLIHMSIDCAERLDCSYQNLGVYEPPSALIDVTPQNALLLRDALTKALAVWRKDSSTPERSQDRAALHAEKQP